MVQETSDLLVQNQLTPPRVNVLGVGISAINMSMAIQIIDTWISQRDAHYVCVATVYTVMQAQRDWRLRKVLNRSGLTTPDGMPLVWLGRFHGYTWVDRVYGPDLLLAVCQHGLSRGYRHFFYGGMPGVAERLAQRLSQRFPGLVVAGTFSPPFRPLTESEDAEIVAVLNEAAPDIIWVGLGSPKQDWWMAEHRGRLNAPVLVGVGAAFDFLSGSKTQAPGWVQRSGFEWLFRLLQEPRRLWRRYLIYNPLFVASILLQLLHLRNYPLDDTNSI